MKMRQYTKAEKEALAETKGLLIQALAVIRKLPARKQDLREAKCASVFNLEEAIFQVELAEDLE